MVDRGKHRQSTGLHAAERAVEHRARTVRGLSSELALASPPTTPHLSPPRRRLPPTRVAHERELVVGERDAIVDRSIPLAREPVQVQLDGTSHGIGPSRCPRRPETERPRVRRKSRAAWANPNVDEPWVSAMRR